MNRAEEIRQKLEKAFSPSSLDVVDESEKHIGHAGYQPGGQSHFRVRIEAAAFAPMSRLERHRAIHGAIGMDLMGQIHALALEVKA